MHYTTLLTLDLPLMRHRRSQIGMHRNCNVEMQRPKIDPYSEPYHSSILPTTLRYLHYIRQTPTIRHCVSQHTFIALLR